MHRMFRIVSPCDGAASIEPQPDKLLSRHGLACCMRADSGPAAWIKQRETRDSPRPASVAHCPRMGQGNANRSSPSKPVAGAPIRREAFREAKKSNAQRQPPPSPTPSEIGEQPKALCVQSVLDCRRCTQKGKMCRACTGPSTGTRSRYRGFDNIPAAALKFV